MFTAIAHSGSPRQGYSLWRFLSFVVEVVTMMALSSVENGGLIFMTQTFRTTCATE